MIYRITKFEEIDSQKLMAIYREGNEENAEYFYPDEKDKAKAIRMVEKSFLNYIKTDFFSSGNNTYWILEINNVWISALRLYRIDEEAYYIEALETHPEFRKHGYATTLLNEVITAMKKLGTFKIFDCVSKKNEASIKTHLKCGFQNISDIGLNYLSNEKNEKTFGMQYVYHS
jgi:ribosomal protein S18 acetylase RimI-like enzyme